MIAPADDPGILLSAMGEYQDQQHVATGDHAHPTMVCADWTFHEQRTGFDREKICHILPQLVAAGLAQGLGAGMVWGYRASDGYAWITDRGQLQLAAWRQPAPQYQTELAALGTDAAARLHNLLAHAAASGVTKHDLDRLEALCQATPADIGEPQDPQAATADTLLPRDSDLARFLVGYVLPFLRHAVGH